MSDQHVIHAVLSICCFIFHLVSIIFLFFFGFVVVLKIKRVIANKSNFLLL